jgi:hypothetical protein
MSSKKYTDDIKKEKQPKKYFLHGVSKKLKIMLFWSVNKNETKSLFPHFF